MIDKNFLLVLLLVGVVKINGDIEVRSDIKGRLLTPEEGCGLSGDPTSYRIIGGGPAKKGAWPWLALLGESFKTFRKTHYIFSCGGSLITTRHVLSAAHCFKQNQFDTVRLGEYDIASKHDAQRIDIPIARVDKHASYSTFLVFHTNDIALVHLAHDVEFNDHIRPICLPVTGDIQSQSFIDTNPFVAGWGHLQQNSGRMSDILHQVQVPIIENVECREKYQKIFRSKPIPDIRLNETSVFCAGYAAGGRDACQGDSGGPLMTSIETQFYTKGLHIDTGFPFYQIGIVSSGLGCGKPNIPGLYTNILHQMDWIQKKLKI